MSLLFLASGALLYGGIVKREDTGFKYFKNYSPQEYENAAQNWSIIQDKRGVIYVGNQGGLLEYDGVSWRDVDELNFTVRSLALDGTGTIYVGGNNKIGFFDRDSKGTLHYISLLEHLNDHQRAFSVVMRMHATGDGIYFRTSKFLFRWNPSSNQMKTWNPLTPDSRFYGSFMCSGKFFVRHKGLGLMQMVRDSLQLVPGGEIFAEKGIFAMFSYDAQKYLVGTRANGFYLYDGTKIAPFPTEADDYIKEKKLSHGIRLSSLPGHFALATLRGGLIIMDKRGRVTDIFTKTSGLQDDNVKFVLEDSGGKLWLAMNKGISNIEYTSPISVYDERSNLSGIVLSVIRHGPRQHLYVGTTRGLYYLDKNKFLPVPGISSMCNFLLSVGTSILAATSDGIFRVDNKDKNNIHPVISGSPSYFLLRSQRISNRIWMGTARGLFLLYSEEGQWTGKDKFKTITEEVASIVEDNEGDLWLGTFTEGVLKIDFSGDGSLGAGMNLTISRYNTSHGLPPGEVHVFKAAGHVIAATQKGILRFDEKNNAFTPDDTFGKEFAGISRHVFRIAEDKNQNIWFASDLRIFQAVPQADGAFILNSKPFLRLPPLQVNTIYPDPDGKTLWFSREDGLIRFDTTIEKNYQQDFSTLIRRAQLVNDKSLIFDGSHYTPKDPGIPFPIIEYKNRNLRFQFAAPFFEEESATGFQYFLKGYDEGWSEWTSETQKDYTNLDAGTYTFRVRAKNVYEHVSKEDTFRFKVLPPWYGTWWAYAVYALCTILLFYLVIKWRHRRLVNEKKQLEQIVKDRTGEIEDKNRQLEHQSEQLKELDEAKSRFFANISHEFRTPLTLIMGPLEQILSKKPGNELKNQAHLMLRNSHRLLNLVNQLLELARLDSGKMKLQASEQNIVPFLKSLVMCFESLAVQNKVALTVQKDEEIITLYFDTEKLEKIISNLMSNAFKYTPADGRITVTLREIAENDRFPSGCVEISVRDTGTGIPEDQLPQIFDRFYRAEGGHEHKQRGSGIGLALTKELVLLHQGEIDVNSSCYEGDTRGTEFIVRLPLGTGHLQSEEIAEIAEPGNNGQIPGPGKPLTPSTADTAGTYEYEAEKEEEEEKEEKPLILVVDDNPDVRAYIKGALEPHFKVVEAAGGKEGVLRAKEILPDLIVSDVMMPETDGYELCRLLKKDILTSHIPILLLTAKVSEESEREGLETGADDYITKPFSTAVLTVRIRNLIDLRRKLQLERKNRMSLQPEAIPVSPIDDEFYNELQSTVDTYLSDPDFNVEALSKLLQMSQATLYRKIHALTGKTPTLFIRVYRLKRAAQLLGARAGSVSNVAVKVGFADASYFARCFKEQFNRLPSDYRLSNPAARGASLHGPGDRVSSSDIPNPGLYNRDPQHEGGPGDRVSSSSIPNPGLYNSEPRHGAVTGPAESLPLPESTRTEKEIILVVEDSDDARNYIRQSLEPDYRVVEAAGGGEGIARAMEILPDLVICDVMMPGTDGFELCRVLKKDVRTSHIPIVLLTARATEESKISGLEAGADDYITKPFNTVILQVRIKNLIRLRSHLQEKRHREMTLLPAKISESDIDREFIKELNAVIEKNLSDPDFNVDQSAKKLYMSSATLYRKIHALTGEVPSEYIRSFRLHRAAKLFKSNFGSVTEVAFEVGFTSRTYFTRCFKEKFHQLPSVFMASESR